MRTEQFLEENPELRLDSKYSRSEPLGHAVTNLMTFYNIEQGAMVDLLLEFLVEFLEIESSEEDEELALSLVRFAQRRYNSPKKRGKT